MPPDLVLLARSARGRDDRAPAGLAVKQALGDDTLPPTAPMPMYLDSPGFTVLRSGNTVRVIVPVSRVGGNTDFNYDAVTALMRVDASGQTPLLIRVSK